MKILKFFIFCSFCYITNLWADSGNVWQKELPYMIDYIEKNENLIMVAAGKNFYILEKDSGNIILEKKLNCNVISGITPIFNNILLSNYCGKIIMINKEGEILYEKEYDQGLTKALNCGGYIFVQCRNNKLYCLYANNLEKKDFFESGNVNYCLEPFCASDKILIYQGFDKKGYAKTYFFDIPEGKIKFKKDFGFLKKPILFEDKIIFLSGLKKHLLILMDFGGNILKKINLNQEIISFYKNNNNLFILSKKGISIYSKDLNLIKKVKFSIKKIPLNKNSVLFDNYILSANLKNIFIYNYVKDKIKKISLSLKKDETQPFSVKIYYYGSDFIIATYKNYLYCFNIDMVW